MEKICYNPKMDEARAKSIAVRKQGMEARLKLPLLIRENQFLRALVVEAGLAAKLPATADILDGVELYRL